MLLKGGYMTLKDLSAWFGLKPETISNGSKTAREKKLQKLTLFCDYHLDGKRIYIDKVFIPEYTKAFDVINNNFDKEWGYIVDKENHKLSWQYETRVDSCTRVAKAIQYKHPEAKQIKETTAISYTCQAKKERYGRTYKDEVGLKGYCQIVYLNQDKSGLLNDKQIEILNECRAEAYKDVNEQRYKIDEAKAIGEITKKEWQEAMGEVNTEEAYANFQDLLYEKLGFIPIRRTQLVDNVCAEK